MNKKVGLVTYYGDNYGACLQAYALQTSINKLNYECGIIEYKNIFVQNKKESILSKASRVLKEGDIKHVVDRYKTSRYIAKANQKRHEACEQFRQTNLQIERNNCLRDKDFYITPPDFDIYVCGSDQIWNPTFYGKCHPIYYLDFVPLGKKRVAYAPSVGVRYIDEKYTIDLKKYLNKFNSISVREVNSVELLSQYTSKKIEWVLDPTLLLREEDYLNLKSNMRMPQKPYIFCYLFGEEKNICDIKNRIKSLTNMPIVSIPFVRREILSKDIKIMNAGPIEFINLIKNAALVLTDSFHATAFSINFKVPFVSLLRQREDDKNEMSSRIKSILSQLSLETRLVRNIGDIPSNLIVMDFSSATKRLDRCREVSMKYLEKALDDK